MILLRLCRNILLRLLVALVIISSLVAPSAFCQESEDSQVFIAGFNAYQQKDYASSIEKMNEVLQKYPDTPLRDMALFWLSRSYFKVGNQLEAARYLSLFSKEYPDNPLKNTVEEELLSLVNRYEKGEKLSTGSLPVKQPDRLTAKKTKAEKERIAAAKAEEAKKAATAAESARIAALKQAEENAAAEKRELARVAAEKAELEKIAAAKAETAAAEAARVAALKQAEEKAVAEKRELERVAAVKAEQERIAVAKAEEAKLAADEAARVAALKQAEEKAAADKKELEVAAAKAEQERIAAAKAEEAKLAAAESARVAALKQAEEKAAADKKELERVAAVKAEQELLAQQTAAHEKAEQQRIAAIKSEDERKAAEQQRIAVEAERIALLKQAEEKAAADKKELERVAAAKAEQERIAEAKAEEAKLAAAESERIATLKQAEEKAAADKKELERIAVVKAEQERIAQETAAREVAEQQRIAAAKAEEALRAEADAETARIAAQKAEAAHLTQAQVEQERVAQAEAELTRMNALKAENERKAAEEKAVRERTALVKTEEANMAAATAEAARLASLKAEEERKSAETVAREAETSQSVALKSEEGRLAQQKLSEEKVRSAKLAYREKAISQYKSIIDKFPASAAAVTAAAKLRELGVAVALPPQATDAPLPENAQVLRLEVAQFAGLEFSLLARPDAFPAGRPATVPFEVINRGNGKDTFYLESAFPADFKARFASAAAPDTAISQTPDLAPGEIFKGVISLVIPSGSIDGLRITHPVKAASRLMAEASQSREVKLIASAPLLRAVLRTEKIKPLPGDKVLYRIAILNVGSNVAQDVTFRLNFPPQLEPVDYAAAGFRQEMKSALVLDGLQVNSGENREFSMTFQLKDDSLAGQELTTRADLINNQLKTTAAFVSNIASVEAQRSVSVITGSDRLVAIPGQTVTVPFVVTNTGNIRETFKIASTVTGAQGSVIFNDLNRDGIRQATEPVINEIGPLAPREEASVVVEVKAPNSAVDGSQGSVQVTFISEGDVARSASGSTQLTYSRPVLKMLMAGRDDRPKPGDIASFDLTITNNGSNLARVVELQSAWPEQLELVAAVPETSSVSNGNIFWRFKEMGAGEKRSIKVSFRVKTGTGVGTALQVKNILTYEDQLGNRY